MKVQSLALFTNLLFILFLTKAIHIYILRSQGVSQGLRKTVNLLLSSFPSSFPASSWLQFLAPLVLSGIYLGISK